MASAAIVTQPGENPSPRRDWLSLPVVQFGLCLAVALLTRAFAFGDPVYHVDENWYLFVGERLNKGDRLYLDIWDRKPPVLFLLYRLFAIFPNPVLAYQFAASLCAAGSATLVWRMANHFTTRAAAMVSALLYLTMLVQLGGAGGQSPVFYNLLIAAAALIVGFMRAMHRDARPRPLAFAAMVMAGTAIMVKPTAAFEAMALGCWLAWRMWQAGLRGRLWLIQVAKLALAGAIPVLIVLGCFALSGDFGDFWQATVMSNFAKEAQIADPLRWQRFQLTLAVIAFPLGATILAFVFNRERRFVVKRSFLLLWVSAAVVGFLSVPNFYDHYLLPLILPLSVVASGFLGRSTLLTGIGVLGALAPLAEARPWDTSLTAEHRAQYAKLANAVRHHGVAPRMLVYDGPPSLYAEAGAKPLTRLSFPAHLWDRSERNVGRVQTAQEMARIISQQPEIVVMGRETSNIATNLETRAAIEAYIVHCRRIATARLDGWIPVERLDVYANCAVP